MTTNAFSSAGSTLAITASLPAAVTATGFGALTFTDVGEIVNMGEFGAEYETVTHTPLSDSVVYKFKGAVNYGALELSMGRVVDDAGQVVLLEALDSSSDYSFEVTLADGSIAYFRGKVMSYRTGLGENNSITSASTRIEITSPIITVAA